MNRIFLLAMGSLALAGCSSLFPQHACPLNADGSAGVCSSMGDTYRAARAAAAVKNTGHSESVLPFGQVTRPSRTSDSSAEGAGWAPPANQEAFQGFAQPKESGSPVYTPPRVHRAWVAPWTDADGRLHGGEYTYFTTAGGWNYGSLRSPGQAGSAMMGPLRPGQVGFKIDPVNKNKSAEQTSTAQPRQSQQAPLAPKAPGVQAPDKRAYTQGQRAAQGVTQPYSQFGQDEEDAPR